MEELKYTVLLDYIVRILRNGKIVNPTGYISLIALLKAIKHSYSFSEVIEIGKYLETMGWVKATYPLGDVRLQISTSGMVYVEGKGEQFEKEYAAFIDKLRGEYPDGKIPTVHIMKVEDNPKDAIFALLDSILTKMKGIQGDNGELVKDIEVVKLELSKLTPDLRMIEIKLENLSGIDSIRDEVQELKTYLMK